MEKNFTSEDILAFLLVIGLIYGIITLFQKKLQQVFSARMDLYKWGMNIKLSDSQQKYLMQLWYYYKKPEEKLDITEDILNLEDRQHLEKISKRDYLPENLKIAYSEKKRHKYYQLMIKQGFSEFHAQLLCGIILNKIAGISSIKEISIQYIKS